MKLTSLWIFFCIKKKFLTTGYCFFIGVDGIDDDQNGPRWTQLYACCPSAKGLVLGVLVHTAWCLLGVLVHWLMVFAVSQRKRWLRVELCSYLQEHLCTWAAIYTIWFLYLQSSTYCNTICSLVPSLFRGLTIIMLPCRSIAWFVSCIYQSASAPFAA